MTAKHTPTPMLVDIYDADCTTPRLTRVNIYDAVQVVGEQDDAMRELRDTGRVWICDRGGARIFYVTLAQGGQ